LINAEHAVRIASVLEGAGIPADRYLEQAKISPRVREAPTGFLPGRSVWSLVAFATRDQQLGDFWLDVARLGDWRRARWVRPMTDAVTLQDAIRIMCSSYVRQIPMNMLGLTVDGPVAWFWRRRTADTHDWEGATPAEQYSLSFMLEVTRSAAGPSWLPERIKIESTASAWGDSQRLLPGVRIEYNQPLLALAIPLPMLSIPVSITPPPAAADETKSAPADFVGSLREVLHTSAPAKLLSQEFVAELLWVSPRTLRRRLAEAGTSWRAVQHDIIYSRAVERLTAGRVSVRELAEELGYANPEHFIRFFKNRTGVPPGAYRAEVEEGKRLAM
jgi:AraC-like DNA-binding protein